MAKTKTKTTKIPKRIAGVKIPKDLRRKGEALIDKANSPAGREVIAGALTMAAAAATAAAARGSMRRGAEAGAADGASKPQEAAAPPPLADAIGNAADMIFAQFFGANRPG